MTTYSMAIHNSRLFIKKRSIVAVLFLLSGMFFLGIASAADYYVSPIGNDNNSGSLSSPWKTPFKAWSTASAGDTVYFRGGIYVISSQIWTKYYGFSGTRQNPITFTSYENEQPVFDCNLLDACFVIEKNWNIIDGIHFVNYVTAVIFGYDLNVDGGVVKNCAATAGAGGDNAGFGKIGGASNITVQNNYIAGPGLMSSGVHKNTAGIYAGRECRSLRIRNNEISNAPIGIYYKHGWNPASDIGIEISGNYIDNVDRFSLFLNCHYANVHDNIIGSLATGNLVAREQNGVAGGTFNAINHNTIWGGHISLDYDEGGAINNTVINNVLRSESSYHYYSSEPHYTHSDYNLFPHGKAIIENLVHYTLPKWQSHSGSDMNSFSGNPLFWGGAIPSSISGFLLMDGSLGKNSADDGKDMGADIDIVGVHAKISGYVYDLEGEPIEDAKVKCKGKSMKNDKTDEEGCFEFENIKDGKYKITVIKKGYKKHRETVVIDNEKDVVEIEVKLEEKR